MARELRTQKCQGEQFPFKGGVGPLLPVSPSHCQDHEQSVRSWELWGGGAE